MAQPNLVEALSEIARRHHGLPAEFTSWLELGAPARSREMAWRGARLSLALLSPVALAEPVQYGFFTREECGLLRIGAVSIGGDILLRLYDGAILYYDPYEHSSSGGDGPDKPEDAELLYDSFAEFMANTRSTS